MSKKSFTLIELLIAISIIGLLASIVFAWSNSARAKARDTKRIAESDTLRKGLEMHYVDNDEYPGTTDWIKIEEDADANGPFSQATQLYFPQMPRDPLYPKEVDDKVFSYQYKSTEDEQGYKIHIEMETGEYASYEVYSGGGDVIVYGGGAVGEIGPPAGYALQFDGIDDYVEVADSDSLDVVNALSIELWIRPNTVTPRPDWSPIVAKKCNYAECYGILVTVDQTYLYFYVQGGGVSFAGLDIETEEWQHVIGTWDRNVSGDNIFLYVDNGERGEGGTLDLDLIGGGGPVSTDPIVTSNLPLYMGGGTGSGYSPYYFDGLVDEIRIYAKALPESLIQEHFLGDYSGDSTGCAGGDCDLRALWRFDEGFGTAAADGSGNKNNGTLINNPQWISVP